MSFLLNLFKHKDSKRIIQIEEAPLSVKEITQSKTDGLICKRCNRPITQRIESGRDWCSWCNDWVLTQSPRKKVVKPVYPTSISTIPAEAREFQVDEDSDLLPIGEYSCPVCGESLGNNLELSSPNVIVRFKLRWGGYFWWSVVSHCGRKLIISNRGK